MAVTVVLAACALVAVGCGEKSTVTGEAGKALTIHQPAAVTITRGESAKVTIAIDRNGVEGPVSITFTDLPVGVTVEASDMKIIGNNEGVYTLMATKDAQMVANNESHVTATGGKNMSATVKMMVTVEEKK
jgi:hypothetical protein